MITLFIVCLVNGFLFHLNVRDFTEEIKMIIIVICVANDLNLLATLSRK